MTGAKYPFPIPLGFVASPAGLDVNWGCGNLSCMDKSQWARLFSLQAAMQSTFYTRGFAFFHFLQAKKIANKRVCHALKPFYHIWLEVDLAEGSDVHNQLLGRG